VRADSNRVFELLVYHTVPGPLRSETKAVPQTTHRTGLRFVLMGSFSCVHFEEALTKPARPQQVIVVNAPPIHKNSPNSPLLQQTLAVSNRQPLSVTIQQL